MQGADAGIFFITSAQLVGALSFFIEDFFGGECRKVKENRVCSEKKGMD